MKKNNFLFLCMLVIILCGCEGNDPQAGKTIKMPEEDIQQILRITRKMSSFRGLSKAEFYNVMTDLGMTKRGTFYEYNNTWDRNMLEPDLGKSGQNEKSVPKSEAMRELYKQGKCYIRCSQEFHGDKIANVKTNIYFAFQTRQLVPLFLATRQILDSCYTTKYPAPNFCRSYNWYYRITHQNQHIFLEHEGSNTNDSIFVEEVSRSFDSEEIYDDVHDYFEETRTICWYDTINEEEFECSEYSYTGTFPISSFNDNAYYDFGDFRIFCLTFMN